MDAMFPSESAKNFKMSIEIKPKSLLFEMIGKIYLIGLFLCFIPFSFSLKYGISIKLRDLITTVLATSLRFYFMYCNINYNTSIRIVDDKEDKIFIYFGTQLLTISPFLFSLVLTLSLFVGRRKIWSILQDFISIEQDVWKVKV